MVMKMLAGVDLSAGSGQASRAIPDGGCHPPRKYGSQLAETRDEPKSLKRMKSYSKLE
jgi:hypothetical protein